jgi:hypothetical protein
VFISPPEEVVRQSEERSLGIDQIPPTQQALNLLITFPDGIERQIDSSQLIVDGVVVEENNSAPFDVFSWDLSGYAESQDHTVRATVEDEFGLRASTVDTPIYVEVILPPRGLTDFEPVLGSLILAVSVLVTGVVLAVVLITRNREQASFKPDRETDIQALHNLKRAGLSPNDMEAFEALIRPMNLNGEPIKLIGVDQIIGRDASLANIVVDDPSVAGIHARLIRQADGDYLIKDQGSVSGTWVNYKEVGDNGIRLKHEDRIQIGRIAFLFELAIEPRKYSIEVIPASDSIRVAPKDQNGESND